MPLEYQIMEVGCSEVYDLIGNAVLVDSQLSADNEIFTRVMFTSPFMPVEVTSSCNGYIVTYNVIFDAAQLESVHSWYITMTSHCPSGATYAEVSLNEPLDNGKRGGNVVCLYDPPAPLPHRES